MKTDGRRTKVGELLGGLATLAILLLGGAGPAAADWSSTGPFIVSISALALDPQTPALL